MKNLKNISALFLLVTAFAFGACSQDETMDELLSKTEINSPSPASPDPEDSGETDKPGG